MVKGYYIYDRFKVTDGQQVFNTSRPYLTGTLTVYLNGLLMELGKSNDYVEVDNTTIQFNYELASSDEVIITSVFSSDSLSIEVISNNNYNPNSLYKKYGSSVKLQNNSKFHISISLKNKSVNWSFTSKYSPLHSTVEKIRMDTGDLLINATDEQIYYQLYLNSKEIAEYVRVKEGITGGVTGNEATTINPTMYTKAWCRYKTDLDLVNSIYLSLCGVSGNTVKKIGTIDIERQVTLPYLKDMLSRFKALWIQQDDYIKRESLLVVQSFTKAQNATYSSRGTF